MSGITGCAYVDKCTVSCELEGNDLSMISRESDRFSTFGLNFEGNILMCKSDWKSIMSLNE